MWDELDLADMSGAPSHPDHPPPLGHESMERLVSGLAEVIRAVAARMRRTYGADEIERVLSAEALTANLEVRRFLEESAREFHALGASAENALSSADLLGLHIEYACNFELYRRKTFCVDEGLAWMLSRTNLDIVGDALRSPFACFALVFTDRDTPQGKPAPCRTRWREPCLLIRGGLLSAGAYRYPRVTPAAKPVAKSGRRSIDAPVPGARPLAATQSLVEGSAAALDQAVLERTECRGPYRTQL